MPFASHYSHMSCSWWWEPFFFWSVIICVDTNNFHFSLSLSFSPVIVLSMASAARLERRHKKWLMVQQIRHTHIGQIFQFLLLAVACCPPWSSLFSAQTFAYGARHLLMPIDYDFKYVCFMCVNWYDRRLHTFFINVCFLQNFSLLWGRSIFHGSLCNGFT